MNPPSDLAEVGLLLEEAFAGGACIWLAGDGKGKIEGTITPELRAKLKIEGPKVRRWIRWNLEDSFERIRQISGDAAARAWVAQGEAAGFWMSAPDTASTETATR